MEVKTRAQEPPAELLATLQAARLHYTDPVDIYHYFASSSEDADCGFFGDGDNAAYEWFIWRRGVLETSDSAYDIQEMALRDVFNRVFA